ncbi:sulfotransferase [Microbulbifer magnicolonia]|uniref:sulfotransferase n=1 Tax=Microbulbifer magnicolonia TaxID=3109744 RepID=UPI002B40577E|nr:sulfotransferase [Microbulbifer sp. GG15]
MSFAAARSQDADDALQHVARGLARDPAAALAQLGALLADNPHSVYGRQLKAVALRLLARAPEALAVLEPLVAEHPGFAEAQYELGLCLRALGRLAESAEALRRAVTLKGDFAPAWKSLGDALLAQDNKTEGEAALGQFAALSARDPQLRRALQALQQGQLALAEQLCRDYLKRRPADVTAIRLLAELGLKLGRYADAEKLLSRCLELAPDFLLARYNYTFALIRLGRHQQALAELDTLLAAEADNPNYLILKGATLVRLARYDEALAIYERLLAQSDSQPQVQLSYGHTLKTVGRQAQAIAAYRRAAALDPELGEAWWSLANLKTVQFDSADLAAMRDCLNMPAKSVEQRAQLLFALGKACEDAALHEESFAHYAEGNRLRRTTLHYSTAENAERTDATIELFTPEFLAARADFGCEKSDPIFIVGLPRSGSTLIEQILASHSQIEGTMELPDVIAMSRRLGGRRDMREKSRYPGVLAELSPAQWAALGEEYLERTRVQRRGKPFFIDKMPNNFAHIGFIHLMLPNAKIIDARRHPIACCFSNFKQHFARGQRFSYELGELGAYYRDYLRLMDHFDAVLPGRVLRVQYEDTVADLEGQVRRLLDYCGLPFEQACLDFHNNKRAVHTASSEQVRRPVYRDALSQFRPFLPQLQPLIDALGPEVMARYPL